MGWPCGRYLAVWSPPSRTSHFVGHALRDGPLCPAPSLLSFHVKPPSERADYAIFKRPEILRAHNSPEFLGIVYPLGGENDENQLIVQLSSASEQNHRLAHASRAVASWLIFPETTSCPFCSSSSSRSRTSCMAAIAHSIISSSGSRVVRYCICMPGQRITFTSALSGWLPAHLTVIS